MKTNLSLQERIKLPIVNQKNLVTVLKEAGLISDSQIKAALKYQEDFPELSIEEVIALKGWLDPCTCIFFLNKWHKLVRSKYRKPLGYYLFRAGLLEKSDIKLILLEQQTLPYRFGKIAVMKGYIQPTTVDFFLKYLFPEELGSSPFRSFESLVRSRKRHYLYCSEAIRRNKLSKVKQEKVGN